MDCSVVRGLSFFLPNFRRIRFQIRERFRPLRGSGMEAEVELPDEPGDSLSGNFAVFGMKESLKYLG